METRVFNDSNSASLSALFTTQQPRTPGIHSQKQPYNTMVTPTAGEDLRLFANHDGEHGFIRKIDRNPNRSSRNSIQIKQGDKEAQEDCVGSSNSEDKVKQNDIENFRPMRFAMKSGMIVLINYNLRKKKKIVRLTKIINII
eukprot:621975_1